MKRCSEINRKTCIPQ
jgi:hypothetical protein